MNKVITVRKAHLRYDDRTELKGLNKKVAESGLESFRDKLKRMYGCNEVYFETTFSYVYS
jgi:hypothetical protein